MVLLQAIEAGELVKDTFNYYPLAGLLLAALIVMGVVVRYLFRLGEKRNDQFYNLQKDMHESHVKLLKDSNEVLSGALNKNSEVLDELKKKIEELGNQNREFRRELMEDMRQELSRHSKQMKDYIDKAIGER